VAQRENTLRLSCQAFECKLSMVEQGKAGNALSMLDQVRKQCVSIQKMRRVPPDVASKVGSLLSRYAELYAVVRTATASTSASVSAAVDVSAEDVSAEETAGTVPLGGEGECAGDDFLSSHEQMLSQSAVHVSARHRRHVRASQRERENARSRHPLAPSEEVGEAVMCEEHQIQTCAALGDAYADERCPICWSSWREFPDCTSLAVVLPCGHAACLKCLSQRWKIWRENSDMLFDCVLCRGLLLPTIVEGIAAEVLEQHSADSGLATLVQQLSMPVRAQKALLASLLVLQDFDFSQVLAKLMDIVGSLGHVRPDLTSEQKQRIVAQARKKEKYLREQLKQVRKELEPLLGLGTAQGRTLRVRINRVASCSSLGAACTAQGWTAERCTAC
jgi:hypothetical protein